ncbi:hypothetical protein GQ457_14G023340 [Hibiscus cannabinus]
MVENSELSKIQKTLTTIQQRLTDLEDEEKVPKWWSKHQDSSVARITTLETRMNTTQSYLEQILQAVRQQGGDSSPDSATKTPAVTTQGHTGKTGQTPTVVTILDDNERFSYKPREPGLLAAKPVHTTMPPLKLKAKMDDILKEEPLSHHANTSAAQIGNTHINSFRPKIELQMFDGMNPRGWIKKCQKYFTLLEIPEERKMDLATMHLEGKAETWFDGYILQKHRISWHEFAADLCHRFCDRTYADVIEEFNKLVQKSTVEDYQERFEELKPYMIQQNPYLEETYFVSSFLSGLKEELRHRVKVHQPQSLNEAYMQAKLHELSMEIESKKFRTIPYTFSNPTFSQKPTPPTQPTQQKPANPNTTQTNTKQTLMEYRRTHNLCFKCGWAKEGVEVISTTPLIITVANGEKLYSTAKAKQLHWKMQGYQFQHDFRVLSMGGSDMVLGVDWMKKYSPVSMDFNEMTLSFYRDSELISLKGGAATGTIQLISGAKLQKLAEKDA